MAQKPDFENNEKVSKKVTLVISVQTLTSPNSPPEYAGELFKNSKDS